MVLECCSKVFATLVVFRLLLQSVFFVVLCYGGPGRLLWDCKTFVEVKD